jgi:DNA helicase-2/ATP-dependent DNA helicase PcrA
LNIIYKNPLLLYQKAIQKSTIFRFLLTLFQGEVNLNAIDEANELQRLEMVLGQIRLKIDEASENQQASRGELQNALADYWESPGVSLGEQSQLTEAVQRQRSLAGFSQRRRLQYVKMASSPYFGRIDFAENGLPGAAAPEMIYIGIATLTESKTGVCLVYDWRSPVAGMFYDYELGNAQYQCPAGTISGKIVLKRQYKIKNGRMEYMFDSDLKIDDEMLQELLGKSVNDKMRTIVNTIQREQNRAIRDEKHPVLLVQGPAGSGKTSIALHRAAYLLYLERNRITAKNILILSPNQIFIEYISGVLPELGEENVLQSTFKEYVSHKMISSIELEDFTAQLECLLAEHGKKDCRMRAAGISYKASAEFAEIIENYLAYLSNELIKDYPAIEFRGRMIFSKEDWQLLFFNNLVYLPVTERLKQIRRRIQNQMKPLVHELRREKEQEITATGEEVNERVIKALARLAARGELIPITAQVERLTTAEPLLLFRRLFEDEDLFRRLAAGAEMPEDWPAISKQSLDALDQGRLFYEDSIPFLYFQGCLTGFPVRSDIRHVIIDEAQDYTGLQFAIFKRIFPRCSWTVLGDPDQRVNLYQRAIGFEKVANILNEGQPGSPLIVRLRKSYRSTQEIQAFSSALLGKMEAEHIRRSGILPHIVKVRTSELIADCIAGTIQELQDTGLRSIAVITKTAVESAAAYEALKNKLKITHITWEMDEFQSGTVLIPAYLAKGLEFDAVLIYNAAKHVYGREEERSILYVACTRALHRLLLFYSGELSPLLAAVHKDLYDGVS